MHPATAILLAAGTPKTGTAELSVGFGTTSAVVGLLIGVLGWAMHHVLAQHHRILDFIAKLLIVAGSTLLFAGPGAHFIPTLNGWSVDVIAPVLRWMKISDSWVRWCGILCILEGPLLVWAVGVVIRLAKNTGGGGAAIGAGGRGQRGKILARAWDRFEHYCDRYGLILIGPNSASLPGLAGYWAAWPFASLAGFFVHTVPHLLNMVSK